MASSSTLTADFVRLQKTIFVSYGDRGREGSAKMEAHDPSIVLLLGWVNAPMSLLFKYAHAHRSIYPHAAILVVETPSSFLLINSQQRERRLQSAADILMSTIYEGGDNDSRKHGLLIHAISNGGSLQLMTLASMLARKHANISNSPRRSNIPIALVVDSAPGIPGFMTMLRSFISSTLSPNLNFILSVGCFGVKEALSREPLMPALGRYMGQPDIIPLANKATPRLYIYSDADPMTPMQGVERHIAALAGEGYHITAEKYTGSMHISHMKRDPARYWKAVRRIWDDAVDNSGGPVDNLKAKL